MSRQSEVVKTGGELVASSNFELVAERLNGLSTKLDIKPFQKMFTLAQAMNELREALTDEVMEPIMALQGSRVGFKTDKDTIKNKETGWVAKKGPGYPIDIVREVTMEAILFGAYMTGNEVNILAGQMYATKEHFVRKVRELDGLTDLSVLIGTPVIEKDKDKDNGSGVAKIRCKAKWKMHGVEQSVGMDDAVPLVFSTRVYDRDGGHSVAPDMALGKVTRKLYKHIYETATGSKVIIPDGDAEDMARDVDAKVVDRATIDLGAIKAGDATAHTPVDAPQPAPVAESAPAEDLPAATIEKRDDAYSTLNAAYDEHANRIDGLLADQGQPPLPEIPRDTADEEQIAALIIVKNALAKKGKA